MRWKLIPVFADGKGRERTFAYVLAMIESEHMTDTQMYAHRQIVSRWCYQQFQHASWRSTGWDFEFKNHEDAVAFKLRWG